jgi:hypothetical protein
MKAASTAGRSDGPGRRVARPHLGDKRIDLG